MGSISAPMAVPAGRASPYTSVELCDTNVLVYAYDVTAGDKHSQARSLVERLWQDGNGAISIQVMQEFFVTVTRKVGEPIEPRTARAILADLATWRVIAPLASDVLEAIDDAERWRLSFWDAMIVT